MIADNDSDTFTIEALNSGWTSSDRVRLYRRDSKFGIPYGWAGYWNIGRNVEYATNTWSALPPLYYVWNRHYHTQLGRWLTPDPIGLWGDPAQRGNPYQYCGSAPALATDPRGLMVWAAWDGTDESVAGWGLSGDWWAPFYKRSISPEYIDLFPPASSGAKADSWIRIIKVGEAEVIYRLRGEDGKIFAGRVTRRVKKPDGSVEVYFDWNPNDAGHSIRELGEREAGPYFEGIRAETDEFYQWVQACVDDPSFDAFIVLMGDPDAYDSMKEAKAAGKSFEQWSVEFYGENPENAVALALGTVTGGLGDDIVRLGRWIWRAQKTIAKSNTCVQWAKKIHKQLDGGDYILIARRGSGTMDRDGVVTDWGYHVVVKKDGKYYDRFTGPQGETAEEFRRRWGKDQEYDELSIPGDPADQNARTGGKVIETWTGGGGVLGD